MTIQVNNRKICEGFYRGLGLTDPTQALRAVDKLDKIGPAKVAELLAETAGATEAQAKACLALAEISAAGRVVRRRGARARGDRPAARRGPGRAGPRWWRPPPSTRPACCVAELQIARGLDYYTGTVYETQLRGYERFGSICSGGRYDNLASSGNDRFPGVGISIGVSRMLGLLFGAERAVGLPVGADLRAGRGDRRGAPGGQRPDRGGAARARHPDRGGADRGEVRQADPVRRAARHPVRLVPRRGAADEVKDIRSGEQVARPRGRVDAAAADLEPLVGGAHWRLTPIGPTVA